MNFAHLFVFTKRIPGKTKKKRVKVKIRAEVVILADSLISNLLQSLRHSAMELLKSFKTIFQTFVGAVVFHPWKGCFLQIALRGSMRWDLFDPFSFIPEIIFEERLQNR